MRQAAKNAGYMWGFPHMYPAFFLMIGDHSEQVGALHSLCGLTANGLSNVLKRGAIRIARHGAAAEPRECVGVTQQVIQIVRGNEDGLPPPPILRE